jgi:hypothetical protein
LVLEFTKQKPVLLFVRDLELGIEIEKKEE